CTAAEELITNCLTTIAKQVAAPQRNELLTGSERPGQIDNQLFTSRRRLKRRGARRLEVWRRLVLPPHLVSTARSRAVILDGQGLDQIAFLGMGGANDGGCREREEGAQDLWAMRHGCAFLMHAPSHPGPANQPVRNRSTPNGAHSYGRWSRTIRSATAWPVSGPTSTPF